MIKRKNKIKKVAAQEKHISQFFWLAAFIIVLTLSIIFVPMIYHQIFGKFEYGGVKFEKTESGKLVFYHGQFPIIYKGNLSAIYNSYFRTDPRKNNIPINATLGLSKNVIITLEPGVEKCQSMALANPQLATFIHVFPFVKNISSATNDRNISKDLNISFANCNNASLDSTILIIRKSETPSITSGNKSGCYILNVGDCQYLETVERYIMGAMAQINNVSIQQ